jgi:hypothetical protein
MKNSTLRKYLCYKIGAGGWRNHEPTNKQRSELHHPYRDVLEKMPEESRAKCCKKATVVCVYENHAKDIDEGAYLLLQYLRADHRDNQKIEKTQPVVFIFDSENKPGPKVIGQHARLILLD